MSKTSKSSCTFNTGPCAPAHTAHQHSICELQQLRKTIEALEHDLQVEMQNLQTAIDNLRDDYHITDETVTELEEAKQDLHDKADDVVETTKDLQATVHDYEREVHDYKGQCSKAVHKFDKQQCAIAKQLSLVRANGALMHLQLNKELGATNAQLQAFEAQLTQHDTTSEMAIEIMEVFDERLDTQSTDIAHLRRTVVQLSRKHQNLKIELRSGLHQLMHEQRKQHASHAMQVQNLDVGINDACGQISNLKRKFEHLEAAQEQFQGTVDGTKRRQTLELRNLNKRMQEILRAGCITEEELEDTKKELEELKRFVRYMRQADKTKNKRQFRHFMKKLSGMRKEFFLGGAVFCATTLGPALLRAMVTTLF